jgi:hypothetical protein
MSNFTVKFTVSVNTENCDPDVLDEVEAHVQDGIMRMLEGKFPSGDCGPDQSYATIDRDSLKVEPTDKEPDGWNISQAESATCLSLLLTPDIDQENIEEAAESMDWHPDEIRALLTKALDVYAETLRKA